MTFVCKHCLEEFKQKRSLDKHAKTVHGDKEDTVITSNLPKLETFVWRCPRCHDIKFARKEELERHVSTVHAKDADRTFERAMYMMTPGMLEKFYEPTAKKARAEAGIPSSEHTGHRLSPLLIPIAKNGSKPEKGLTYCHSRDHPQYRIHYFHRD